MIVLRREICIKSYSILECSSFFAFHQNPLHTNGRRRLRTRYGWRPRSRRYAHFEPALLLNGKDQGDVVKLVKLVKLHVIVEEGIEAFHDFLE